MPAWLNGQVPNQNPSNANLRRDEAARRSALIRVQSYDVSVDLRTAPDPSAAGFTTQSIITFTAAEDGAETFLDFIGGSVHAVILNGRTQVLADVVDGSRIWLRGLGQDNQVTVSAAALYSSSGEGLHRFVDPADGRTYLYTQYEPADARRVFANFEQPDLKAPFSFHVTAPSDWEVASNGALASRTPLASDPTASRWDFATTAPISTYITSILAGPYHKEQDHWSRALADGSTLEVPLAAYCRASLAEHFDPDRIFGTTKAGLDFFHDLFDYPYPFGKYDQAFVPEYNLGAMENPGLVTFTEAYVYTSRATDTQYQQRANTLLHEMAHMWFGDLVTMRWWDDLWLKESFADYMGHLAVAEATGWGGRSWILFANRRKAWAYVQDQLPTTHPIVADIGDLEAAKQNFDGITYAKGASVLKQLVAYVGFEAFTAGSRRYFRDHAYGNTSLSDLLEALSAASGRDLGEWARQWLQTSGISTLAAEVQEDDGVLTRLTLRQDALDPVTGRQEPRPHRLKLGFYNVAGSGTLERTDLLDVDVQGTETVVEAAAGKPRPALLLVNDEDLSYAKVRLDDVSEESVLAGLDRLADPMARALCWSSLWNATRDGVLPPSRYVAAVERFATGESDTGVLASLLDNARTAVERYCPAEERDDVREALLGTVVGQLDSAEAASDRQLVWARAFASLGRHTGSRNQLAAGLLSGAVEIPGLAMDPDLRWSLWQALAATGCATVAELDGELARDLTASARAGHLTAITARPLAQVKEQAWREMISGNSLSNELLSASIEGFRAGPAELLEPYIEPYFGAIDEVWGRRSIEISSRIVRGLFPVEQDLSPGQQPQNHPVVLRTDEWLAGTPDAPAALRRIVVEQRDHLLRALRAQGAALIPA